MHVYFYKKNWCLLLPMVYCTVFSSPHSIIIVVALAMMGLASRVHADTSIYTEVRYHEHVCGAVRRRTHLHRGAVLVP